MKRFFGLKSDHSSQSNDYHRQPQTYSQPSYQQPTQSATTRFRAIRDRFTNLEEVQHELRRNGLESSNLIVGLDFTKVRGDTKFAMGFSRFPSCGHSEQPVYTPVGKSTHFEEELPHAEQ